MGGVGGCVSLDESSLGLIGSVVVGGGSVGSAAANGFGTDGLIASGFDCGPDEVCGFLVIVINRFK